MGAVQGGKEGILQRGLRGATRHGHREGGESCLSRLKTWCTSLCPRSTASSGVAGSVPVCCCRQGVAQVYTVCAHIYYEAV